MSSKVKDGAKKVLFFTSIAALLGLSSCRDGSMENMKQKQANKPKIEEAVKKDPKHAQKIKELDEQIEKIRKEQEKLKDIYGTNTRAWKPEVRKKNSELAQKRTQLEKQREKYINDAYLGFEISPVEKTKKGKMRRGGRGR